MLQDWQEITQSLWRHKLRTLLTAFGVFYGVFVLVMLLAFSTGFERGVMRLFERADRHAVFLAAGRTSLPHDGLPAGRFFRFDEADLQSVARLAPEADNLTPRKNLPQNTQVRIGDRSGTYEIIGIYPGYTQIDRVELRQGRFFNEQDLREQRRVALIGQQVADVLFRDEPEPLGKWIDIAGVSFVVAGVFYAEGSGNEMRRVFLPYTTLSSTFAPGQGFELISFSLQRSEWSALRADLIDYFARRYRFDREDPSALFLFSLAEEFRKVQNLFAGIKAFTLIVGISTLVAGVVSVSNITLVTVKERTREIGIRKALGATPLAVLWMVLQETLIITVGSGYLGLLLGVILTEWLRKSGVRTDFFLDPQVDMRLALGALAILIVSGFLAGILPAQHAARIHPIAALRHE